MKTEFGRGVAYTHSEEGKLMNEVAISVGHPSREGGWQDGLSKKRPTAAVMPIGSIVPIVPIVRDNGRRFEALMRRLTPTLKKIAYKLNVPFSFVDDQDLFQEALIHLWTHFSSGDLDDKTDSYILQGCYFHLKNYLRKVQEPCAMVSLGQPGDEDGTSSEDVLDTRSLLCYDEVEGNLEIEAMEESGITQREKTVLLFTLEGMTTREIGKKLGISHVSVVKIRNRIKEKYTSLNA
jgi:RNA polymerase sigma factor (sigma-70 family)